MQNNIINWEECIKLAGYERKHAEEFLRLLIQDLQVDLSEIKDMVSRFCFEGTRRILHKILGALCYCETPQLKRITVEFHQRLAYEISADEFNKLLTSFEHELISLSECFRREATS